MGQNKSVQDKFNQLRRQAEQVMMAAGFPKPPVAFEDPLKLIQELQTFQIELEMQNEALRTSQAALIKSEQNYTQLYDFAPMGYVTLSLKGRILKTNLTFTDMLSMERCSLIDQLLSDHIALEDQDIYYRYLQALANSKKVQVCELRLQKQDGPLLDVQLESVLILDESKEPWQYRIAIIDISERKQAERELATYRDQLKELVAQRTSQLQQEILDHKRTQAERMAMEAQLHQARKMEIIGTLAGGIAHDFNNILFPMIGFTELAMKALPENHPVKENLEDILHGAMRASELVQQILAFSSQTEVEQKPILLRPVIEEAIKLLRSTIPSNIEIQQEFCVNSEYVLGSSTKIYEVVMNLCTNAFHAMEDTGGTLTIRLTTAEPNQELPIPFGNYCCLSIGDTGTGMPLTIVDKIFDPYFTTKAVGKGSGLGLSVVQGIIASHKGAVTVESEPGKGSVFNVYFPIVSFDRKPVELPDIKTSPTGDERILLVDDERLIVKFGMQFLRLLGYKVTGKTSSVDALALFESAPDAFDLVITDMAMPNMVGTQFAEKLIKIRPDIPIIICSGHSERLDEKFAKTLGIMGYIKKPIRTTDMALNVRHILDQARKRG